MVNIDFVSCRGLRWALASCILLVAGAVSADDLGDEFDASDIDARTISMSAQEAEITEVLGML